jgi:hypothetical protein
MHQEIGNHQAPSLVLQRQHGQRPGAFTYRIAGCHCITIRRRCSAGYLMPRKARRIVTNNLKQVGLQ